MKDLQRILIVDDEPRNQRIAVEILEDHAELKTVASGEAALEALGTFRPDLVLLDIMMPGMDGYEVCKNIRARTDLPTTKIILVSGKAMIDERLMGYVAGADDYMTKPFVAEEMLAKARVFLRLAKMEDQIMEMNKLLNAVVDDQKHQIDETKLKLFNTAKMAALGEMASSIAHEINTPLSTIGILANILSEVSQEDGVDVEMIAKKAGTIDRTVHRIGKIIASLRTFSRDGEQDAFEPALLQKIVEDTLILCREKLKHSDIRLEVANIPSDIELNCRSVQVSQVLLNLISNSCDAIAALPEKWIKIDIACIGNRVHISVLDSGNGVPDSVRAKLFQPFFTTKELGQGTDLGLSISKGIVESHGGTLQVDTYEGHTRFQMDFERAHAMQDLRVSQKGA